METSCEQRLGFHRFHGLHKWAKTKRLFDVAHPTPPLACQSVESVQSVDPSSLAELMAHAEGSGTRTQLGRFRRRTILRPWTSAIWKPMPA